MQKNKGYGKRQVSLTASIVVLVTCVVFLVSIVEIFAFMHIYRQAMDRNAITSSEQSVVQVKNMITTYLTDMNEIMDNVQTNIRKNEKEQNDYFMNLLSIRSDVVAITSYDENGSLMGCWSQNQKLKEKITKNLSFHDMDHSEVSYISSPHVENLFQGYYPWVVSMERKVTDGYGEQVQISMDIRFSNIANYVDDVGIGQHGYCFIINQRGNIVYHPQQQLIYSGIKSEDTKMLETLGDGSYTEDNVIYTIQTLNDSGWRIVGVSYVDEQITAKVERAVQIVAVILIFVFVTSIFSELFFSSLISKPANQLAKAMEDFESSAEEFKFQAVGGSREIGKLSDSFGHMVIQIQELMERVRQEEITLRKTELNALQAQINPHFLYNTLDSIAWMCEEERTQEAVVMVNALASLFRISISKGHELIPIDREIVHAESYLKIQKYRYKNQFTYTFDIDDACRPYLCNKITLQPIIENAIVHGLDMIDDGEIRIGIHEEGADIVITIEDNGVGMTEEQCRQIIHREPGDAAGIGIKNVNDRIKIYFGEAYGLTIQSELDEGTTVIIRIPKIEDESLKKS